MKKMILFLFLIASFTLAQSHSQGNISLVFNDEKISLPINSASIQKGESILLRFKAEYNDSSVQQMVAIEIGLNKLSSKPDAETLEGTRIVIYTRNNKTQSGKDLSIWFNENELNNEKNKSEGAHYGVYNKGKRVSWEINSVSMKVDIISINYIDDALHIIGKLSGTFKSTLAPEGQDAKIEECKFEIVI
ncbi:MAG: hypothetical protein KJN64_07705 [Ignavibacteria bacterium]|nr:hypothetical protein [Ignavibacteria bacterium]MBT8383763.1 hypothetical protein [Ignavibacteria bacterium]MBT8391768.1 hypothetical protein [Ignavibacteria bacterium]NNJ52352.1 hypothetical protein [Ignavibacteriaceae bacterium]NNL20469.1 hypothetical protein [Ignavibacteriaceae bacterium]